MRAGQTERIKLAATMLNNLGTATIVTGLIAPLITSLYGVADIMSHAWQFHLRFYGPSLVSCCTSSRGSLWEG